MARFVMANRRAGKFHESEKAAARNALDTSFKALLAESVNVIGETTPSDQTERRILVFDADPTEVTAKAPGMPADVLIEPEILHYPALTLPLDMGRVQRTLPTDTHVAGSGETLSLTVKGGGEALLGAEVVLLLRGWGGMQAKLQTRTSASGKAVFGFSSFWQPAVAIVVPAGGFWNVTVRRPRNGTTITVPPLPTDGPLGWWHEALGLTAYQQDRGDGIRVGVADTGLGPHPDLIHAVNAGAFIDGNHLPTASAGEDVDMHGTHVCGSIVARPVSGGDHYAGIAPGVRLTSARVFPGPDSGANQGDIANAIDHLSRVAAADLINLSLGSSVPSQIELDAIRDAYERGTLCICAAGNDAGAVNYPAAFPETVAVSALGLEGWGPPGSLSAGRYPGDPDLYGDDHLYLANFSCFGPEITAAGPGVGIIAPVPARFGLPAPYAAMDGTSMASPIVCAALAVLLAGSPTYQSLPRNFTRAQRARAILQAACRDIGLAAAYEGRGLPRLG